MIQQKRKRIHALLSRILYVCVICADRTFEDIVNLRGENWFPSAAIIASLLEYISETASSASPLKN